MGKYNEKLKISTQKYIKNNYDTITTYVPKGDREKYKEYAKSINRSLNSLVVQLLDTELDKQSLKNEQ